MTDETKDAAREPVAWREAVEAVRAKYAHVRESGDRFVMGYNAALDALLARMDGAK